jgi:UPF0755 protein
MAFVLTKPIRWVIGAALVLVAAVLVWFALQVVPLGGPGREVFVTVNAGDSLSTIANELHTEGVIGSPLAFRLDMMLFGQPVVRQGTYGLRQNSSFSAVKAIIGANPNVVNVRPGLTLHEVALQVAGIRGNSFADTFVKDATSGSSQSPFHPNGSLEGLIGAGDYAIGTGESPAALLNAMTGAFSSQASSVGLTLSTSLNGLSAYQLIIAASIVEKEGYYPVNMPKVARVIFNRLARGGALQMDSTVLYALGLDGGTVTPAMLATKTPYNTYLNSGLTPTPICTVSTTAMRAVLHAPPGTWYYFTLISRDGTMAFSTTWKEQLANEQLAASRGIK